jgi:hypothetical protein
MRALDGQDVVFGSFKASMRDMDAHFAENTDRPGRAHQDAYLAALSDAEVEAGLAAAYVNWKEAYGSDEEGAEKFVADLFIAEHRRRTGKGQTKH